MCFPGSPEPPPPLGFHLKEPKTMAPEPTGPRPYGFKDWWGDFFLINWRILMWLGVLSMVAVYVLW